MSETRYCSTCGTLLSANAAMCGECGARFQASPYERRATDAPGAWARAPKKRERTEQVVQSAPEPDVEIISRDELAAPSLEQTALRDNQRAAATTSAPQSAPVQAGGAGPSAAATSSQPVMSDPHSSGKAATPKLDYPLDYCVPASVGKRLLAGILEAVFPIVPMAPLLIGMILIVVNSQRTASLAAQILIGIGSALIAGYVVLMIFLQGSRGFTLAKLVCGLRVTDTEKAGTIGFWRSLGRWALMSLAWWLMAVSISLDPNNTRRGFHDRLLGCTVVDARAGHNPNKPRPDDYERPDYTHYLGDSSVEVSGHENLLADPGAVWAQPSAGSASAPSVNDVAFAPPSASQAPTGAPAAMHAGGSANPAAAWSPPAAAQPPTEAYSMQQPGAAYFTSPPQAQPQAQSTSYAPPAVHAAGGSSAVDQPSYPQYSQANGYSNHAESASYNGYAGHGAQQNYGAQPGYGAEQNYNAQPSYGAQPQYSAPGQMNPFPSHHAAEHAHAEPAQPARSDFDSAPGPSTLEFSEHTQVPREESESQPAAAGSDPAATRVEYVDPSEDADGDQIDEATRIAPRRRAAPVADADAQAEEKPAPVRTIRIVADDETEIISDQVIVVGRNPRCDDGEVAFPIADTTRSVSKTHARIDPTGETIVITDAGSTNGTAIMHADGTREPLAANVATAFPEGASLICGDRSLSVEIAS